MTLELGDNPSELLGKTTRQDWGWSSGHWKLSEVDWKSPCISKGGDCDAQLAEKKYR